MSALVTGRIREHATRLGLTHLTDTITELVARAETEQLGYLEFVDLLLANTRLETTLPMNLVMLGRDGRPRSKNLKQAIDADFHHLELEHHFGLGDVLHGNDFLAQADRFLGISYAGGEVTLRERTIGAPVSTSSRKSGRATASDLSRLRRKV